MKLIATVTILFITTLCAPAQPIAEVQPVKTKLEQFQAKTGAVIITGFSEVGAINAKYGASIFVEAREFIDAGTGAKETGIVIRVKVGDNGREGTAYIDADEIPALIKGIDYITAVDKSATRLKSFQAEYRTRGDLSVGTFSNRAGDISASIRIGRISVTQAFIELPALSQLRALLQTASATLK